MYFDRKQVYKDTGWHLRGPVLECAFAQVPSYRSTCARTLALLIMAACLACVTGLAVTKNARALFKSQRSFSVPTAKEQKSLDETDVKVTCTFSTSKSFMITVMYVPCISLLQHFGHSLSRSGNTFLEWLFVHLHAVVYTTSLCSFMHCGGTMMFCFCYSGVTCYLWSIYLFVIQCEKKVCTNLNYWRLYNQQLQIDKNF